MTRPGEADAVEAALRAGRCSLTEYEARRDAEITVAAAYPIIAAAVREQVAQEIKAARAPSLVGPVAYAPGNPTYNEGIERAAHIARGSS